MHVLHVKPENISSCTSSSCSHEFVSLIAIIVIVNLSRCTYVSDDSADMIFARASYFAVICTVNFTNLVYGSSQVCDEYISKVEFYYIPQGL